MSDPVRPTRDNVFPGDPFVRLYRSGIFENHQVSSVRDDGVIYHRRQTRMFAPFTDLIIPEKQNQRPEDALIGAEAQKTMEKYLGSAFKILI